MRHLITPLDLTVDELNDILALAGRIYRNKEKYSKICDGKKLASLFLSLIHIYSMPSTLLILLRSSGSALCP